MKTRLIVLLVVAVCLLPALARAGDDYPYKASQYVCNTPDSRWGGFWYKNCTDWVAWRMYNNNDVTDFNNSMDGGHWGNAGEWHNNASTVHYVVNSTPVPGCIAEFNYGHVAWVSSVNPDGTVNIEEYNYNPSCGWSARSNVRADYYIHAYHSLYVSNTNVGWVHPGQVLNLQAKYTNNAREYWINSENNSDRHNVELWSCNSTGGVVNSWFTPVGWISGSQRVTTYDGTTGTKINRNGTATFSFQAQVPTDAPTENVRVWFRPRHGALDMDEWGSNGGGLNYYVQVDATLPDPFTVYANPATSNVNNFSFSWTASADGVSGLKAYYWSVNGGAETLVPTTSLSVPSAAYATIEGENTFNVRAEDSAGNSRNSSATFTLTSSPCPGREIPHSCVPSTTCYPAAAANLQTLPTMSPDEWQTVGLPMRDHLKPSVKYSLGFEYRSAEASGLTIGFGSFASSRGVGVAVGQSDLPVSRLEWKTFWSAPFTLTADQLQRVPNLRMLWSPTTKGIEIRNIQLVAY